jgi:peptidoglycan/LPS O-acetylase OafA/YrhL
MHIDNYVFSILVFLIAFLVANFLSKRIHIPIERERDTQLDGLRGILALSVYICHSAAWYHYLHSGSYMQAGPGLFHQFAKVGVFMFFMITGYLFIGKILRERKKGIDWTKFAVSRVLRIAPLYLFAISTMFFIVFVESGFQIKDSFRVMGPDILEWITFTIFGSPILNGYENTLLITSFAQWTLVYEWIFYLSLPLLAMAMNIRVPMLFLITVILLLASIYFNADSLFLPTGFVGGALAALICTHYPKIKNLVTQPIFSIVAFGLVLLQGVVFPEFGFIQPSKLPAAFICCAFLIIAGGNNLFGLLTVKPAKYLGKISYSIYLMHGIVLFCTFRFILGFEFAASLSRFSFGLLIFGITVLLVLVSSVTYYLIEEPAMKQVKKWTNLVKNVLERNVKKPAL